MPSQTSQLLAHLKAGAEVTPIYALHWLGIFRLGARIYDLKAAGHNIDREMIEVIDRHGRTKRVACYRLCKGGEA